MRDIRSIHHPKTSLALVLATVGGLALTGCADTGKIAFCPIDGDAVTRIEASADTFVRPASAEDVLDWSGQGSFDPGAVRTEGQSVPRRLAASLPPDLDQMNSVAQRKRAFVAIVLPLALRMNEAILADRRFVETAVDCGDANRPLSPAARARLDGLAGAYDAKGDLRTLRDRLDGVPPSLLLAQAAIESGWGTSRFAVQGNALFGQRTGASGLSMRPQGLDDAAAVRVAAFPHLLASVRSYIHNLNTQPAYQAFRQRRAALREQGRQPDGLDLASALVAYSERGDAYVDDLKTIIRGNRFEAFDGALLAGADGASDA